MELVAIHLKQSGALLCRTLAFTGVEFDIVEAELTKPQVRTKTHKERTSQTQ